MPIREGVVERDGVDLHYQDWGGDGPPLILIHATGFLAELWRPIAEPLTARFRVVAVDQRGHGESGQPDDGYTFETFADDLHCVIEGLGLERPLAAGHSSGGTTIAAHVARYPGVISRALLIEPILPPPDWRTQAQPGQRSSNSLAEQARRRRGVWPTRDEAYRSYKGKHTFANWDDNILRLYVDEGMRDRDDGQVELKCPPEIEARFFDAVTRLDAWALLPSLTCPTLLAWGANSHLRARGLDVSLQRALPEARAVLVPDAGHLIPQERPAEVARLLEGFLAD